ncbi:hypothetical protein BKA80DRAFT_271038 [Phyllosticta citrichinensis]
MASRDMRYCCKKYLSWATCVSSSVPVRHFRMLVLWRVCFGVSVLARLGFGLLGSLAILSLLALVRSCDAR